MKKDRQATIISNVQIAEGIFEMILSFEDFEDIKGGQFVHIQLPSAAHVLRRPFCICDFDETSKTILVCYAVVGGGTEELSHLESGDKVMAMLPLGNGFVPSSDMKKVMLIGGGMGSAVLPAVARANKNVQFDAFLGFASKNKVVLEENMTALCNSVTIATDDGSYGERGFVTSIALSRAEAIAPDAIFCCGPEVMYKAIARTFANVNIPIYISLEQRMGCGIGACLVCNCKVKSGKDGQFDYLRVCKDGPIFKLSEVEL